YAVAENQTKCLPILEALLHKWPFVAELAISGEDPVPLNRYCQYVACACLYSLFEDKHHSVLFVRESAAHPLIGAVMAATQALRSQAAAITLDVLSWPIGQPIVISDGVKTFKALFG